jgi:hypothetical protein
MAGKVNSGCFNRWRFPKVAVILRGCSRLDIIAILSLVYLGLHMQNTWRELAGTLRQLCCEHQENLRFTVEYSGCGLACRFNRGLVQ